MVMDANTPRSRRALLLGALGGAAAATASAIGRASPVSATNGDVVRVGHTYSSTIATAIVSSGDAAFEGTGTGTSVGLYGESGAGYGVQGEGHSRAGVYGHATSAAGVRGVGDSIAGVVGVCDVGTGVAGSSQSGQGVRGQSATWVGVHGVSGSGTGVDGYSSKGIGVLGGTSSKTSPATVGWSPVGGAGVQGFSNIYDALDAAPSPVHTGVYGSAEDSAAAVGVKGASFSGRGGLFSGKLAQLRLQPGLQASHPAKGKAGDLFVDKSARLWFCKGGNTWTQIA